jgi:murein DD-endopeptidase MepM/ murein hydrolase activator NlpD
VLYYVIFALLFNTDTERRLKVENRMLEASLPEMEEREALLSDVVRGLEARDDRIYEEMFQASSPDVDPVSSLEFLHGLDTIPDGQLAIATEEKLEVLDSRSQSVEDNFKKIFAIISDGGCDIPPMRIPLQNVSFAQIGASKGSKTNPFYKVPMPHDGLDIIASSGEPVYASADGMVSDITRSRKGLGNVVTLSHKGGYSTRYAHLADIQVSKGRSVKAGELIGYVGTSGNSFAPHLHYEVRRDTLVMDPVSHFYASVEPHEYVNMLIMSSATGQSLD